MSDQQELETPELVLLETVIQPVQDIDQSQLDRVHAQPMTQSGSYSLDSAIRVPPKRLLPEEVGTWQGIIPSWSATVSFHKWFVIGIFAVILGILIGIITPWLTAGLGQLFW